MAGGTLNSAIPETTLGDGTVVYFLGSPASNFTSATLKVTTPAGPADGPYWNVDDIRYGTALTTTPPPAVPEPASLLLIGSGLLGVVRRIRKA